MLQFMQILPGRPEAPSVRYLAGITFLEDKGMRVAPLDAPEKVSYMGAECSVVPNGGGSAGSGDTSLLRGDTSIPMT